MKVFEGSSRHRYEDVLRSVGAMLDRRGMREVALVETPDGFLIEGLAPHGPQGSQWLEQDLRIEREVLSLADDDIARFMDDSLARRHAEEPVTREPGDYYQHALRVLGHYIDAQNPRDVLLFEQDGGFVLRLLMATRSGLRHVLAEFTRQEIDALIERAPQLRSRDMFRASADAQVAADFG